MLSIFFYGSMCFFRVETNPQFFFINWFLWFCRWKSNFIYQCNSNTCLCLSKDRRYNNLSYNSVIAFLVFGSLSFLENYWPWLFFSTADTMTFFSSFFLLSNLTRYDYNLTIMKSPKPATDTIYPHIKFWWYRTMLNFYPPFLCRVLAAILKMADILKILKTQNCSSNGDLSLCQNLCLYHYPVRSYQH